jgi:hypothetical protein
MRLRSTPAILKSVVEGPGPRLRVPRERLNILYVSQMPPSPPRFGAQARMHGLMTALSRRHDLTAISLTDPEFDVEDCRRAMSQYCREVILIPNPRGRNGLTKRTLQLRSLGSLHSFEHHRFASPALQPTTWFASSPAAEAAPAAGSTAS